MKQKSFLSLALVMLLPTAVIWAHKIPIDQSEKVAGRQIQSIIQQFTNERGLLLEPNTATHKRHLPKSIKPEPPLGRVTPPLIFFNGLPRILSESN
jgi:hypothetical protein